jgi:hypothetical protein
MEWKTRHVVTVRTAMLVRRLIELAVEIDSSCIDAASFEARVEWALVRQTWPTPADVRSGRVCLSDEELDLMISKVVRFRTILRRAGATCASLTAAA